MTLLYCLIKSLSLCWNNIRLLWVPSVNSRSLTALPRCCPHHPRIFLELRHHFELFTIASSSALSLLATRSSPLAPCYSRSRMLITSYNSTPRRYHIRTNFCSRACAQACKSGDYTADLAINISFSSRTRAHTLWRKASPRTCSPIPHHNTRLPTVVLV